LRLYERNVAGASPANSAATVMLYTGVSSDGLSTRQFWSISVHSVNGWDRKYAAAEADFLTNSN
jgi:hypothetical protein